MMKIPGLVVIPRLRRGIFRFSSARISIDETLVFAQGDLLPAPRSE
jgi:hypothetical protein